MDPAARNAGLANAWVEKALGWGSGELELGQTEERKELIHGDPAKLRANAAQLRGLAKGLAAVGEGLRKLNSHEIKGETADAFRKRVSAEPKKWFQVAHACEQASGALDDVAHTVEWAQREAQEAIDTYGRGKRASERAREAYNAEVHAYNKAVDAYNGKPSTGDTEAPPKSPGAFHDPGAADMETAQEILAGARRQRDEAHDRAQTAIKGTYDERQAKSSEAGTTELNFLESIKNNEQYQKYQEYREGYRKLKRIPKVWQTVTASVALWKQFSKGGQAAQEWLEKAGWVESRLGAIAANGGRLSRLAAGGAGAAGLMGKLNKAMVPFAIAGGLKQAINPDHGGGRGLADRIAGGAQALGGAAVLTEGAIGGSLLASEAALAAVPVAGWAVLGATGAYFAGSYIYDKWGDDIAAGAKTAWNATSHAVTNTVGGAVDATVNAALHPSGAVKAAEHVVDGTVNSVKKLKFW
ncbi:putative T7SS-secreted protein [Streptomyces asiaticus]